MKAVTGLLIAGLCMITFTPCRRANVIGIRSAQEFIDFSNKAIQDKKRYLGTTVILDADIDFSGGLSEQFEPIGASNISSGFLGNFDGQGYTISNLVLNMTAGAGAGTAAAGLFGCAESSAIKNVVMDSSCVITFNYDSTNISSKLYVGGIVGLHTDSGHTISIENCVNMASIYVATSGKSYVYAGGIVGNAKPYCDTHTLKNCANYGDVAISGDIYYGGIGGIIGFSYGSITVENCINNGPVTAESTSISYLNVGGIVGEANKCTIKNCVSANTAITAKRKQKQKQSNLTIVGAIAGSVIRGAGLSHCYWDSAIPYNASGKSLFASNEDCFSYNSSTFELSGEVSIGNYRGRSLHNALNAYAERNSFYTDYPKWLLNRDSKLVSFSVNGLKHVELSSQLILLPSLATDDSLAFDGWYTNQICTEPLRDFEVSKQMTLYGKWRENIFSYTITFDTRGGKSIAPRSVKFNSIVDLPSFLTKDGCTLGYWENDNGDNVLWRFLMPAHDFTLHAVWKCSHISKASELIEFAKSVNTRKDFMFYTVYLDADIDFSETTEEFVPIGTASNAALMYKFKGQGHTISNLAINMSSSQHVGLFGYTLGTTIENTVIDSSCSIISRYSDNKSDAFVGGFIGHCSSKKWDCNIISSIAMASVAFSGAAVNAYVGGLAGYAMYSTYSNFEAINAANYGTVTFTGRCEVAYIGGLIGMLDIPRGKIANSISYGDVTNSGAASNTTYVGGLVGYNRETSIVNCVASGRVVVVPSEDNGMAGMFAGYFETASASNCYWNKAAAIISANKSVSAFGGGNRYTKNYVTSFDNLTFKLSSPVVSKNYNGNFLLDALNSFFGDEAYTYLYAKWGLNEGGKAITFVIDSKKVFTAASRVILFPTPSYTDWKFDGWYTDSEFLGRLTNYDLSRTSATTLYARLVGYKGGLEPWCIALIATMSVVVFIAIVAAVAIFFVRRHKLNKNDKNKNNKRETEPLLISDKK